VEPGPLTAIEVAARCYRKWMGQVSFENDVADYMAHGFVVTRPTCFAMWHIITLGADEKKRWTAGEQAWFVRMAAGDLMELFSCVPWYLPWIAFCRRGDGRVRVYKLERLVRKVEEQRKRQLKEI
jgi:hypothetical protein